MKGLSIIVWWLSFWGTIALSGCQQVDNYTEVNIISAARLQETNFFRVHANRINERINARRPGKFTYAGHIVAEESSSLDLLAWLIDSGFDPTLRDSEGKTLLIKVCERNDAIPEPLIDTLLKNGCDINAQDYTGASPLHYAALYGNTSLTILLLKRGAKVDATDRHGNTPLHFARGVDTVSALLKAGASKEIQNDSGNTPADVAKEHRPDEYKYLIR
jgi:ankyrin repeat protein